MKCKYMTETLLFIGIIAIALLLYGCMYSSDTKEMTAWVSDRGDTVTNIDQRTWNTGPYFLTKNYRIYKVDTKKTTYWFRYGLFSPDIYKEGSPEHYDRIQ